MTEVPMRRRGRIPDRPRQLAVTMASGVAAIASGLLASTRPGIAVVLVGAAGAIWIAVALPEAGLSLGCAGALCAGPYSTLAVAGDRLLILCGLVGATVLLRRHFQDLAMGVIAPLILLLWLLLRLTEANSLGAAKPLLVCAAVVVASASCVARGRQGSQDALLSSLAIAGILFVGASIAFGSYEPSGVRFEGISGNPNRMVYGALLFTPFVMAYGLRNRRLVAKAICSATVAAAVWVVLLSGSAQGVVGLLVLTVCVFLFATRRLRAVTAYWWMALGLGLSLCYLIVGGTFAHLSPDLTSLSGRTGIFSAGWAEIKSNLLVGTGEAHITAQDIVDRSAHNVFIGLSARAGIGAGLLWVVLVLRASICGARGLRDNVLFGAAAVLLLTLQFVQSVEYVPLTWAVLVVVPGKLCAERESTYEN